MKPKLADHLNDMHGIAMQLTALIRLLNATVCSSELEDLNITLVEAGVDMAWKLNNGLDSGRLKEAEA